MNKLKFYILSFVGIIVPCFCFCQVNYSCEIQMPKNFRFDKIRIQYFNGLEEAEYNHALASKRIIISGKLHSIYGSLQISYPGDSIYSELSKTFFLTPGRNRIDLTWRNNKFHINLINAIDIDRMGNSDLNHYTKQENTDLVNFYSKYQSQFATSDSLLKLAFEKGQLFGEKRYDFIKTNPNLFLSFWLFHREIINSESIPPDSLLLTYYTIFPDKFKNTIQGSEIVRTLDLKIKMSNNLEAPDFSAYDINGNEITLSKLDDKITIISFWASWCIPCIKEISLLKKIEQDFADTNLKIILISIDTDSVAFTKALKKYNMTWTNIFGGMNILRMYGPIAIPQLYLINERGKILYNSREQQDEELRTLIELLNKTITSKLKNGQK